MWVSGRRLLMVREKAQMPVQEMDPLESPIWVVVKVWAAVPLADPNRAETNRKPSGRRDRCSVVETSEDAVDHATSLLIAVAIGKFHRLIERDRCRSGQIDQIDHSQSQDVPVDPRQSGETPSLHHRVEARINAGSLFQNQLHPL